MPSLFVFLMNSVVGVSPCWPGKMVFIADGTWPLLWTCLWACRSAYCGVYIQHSAWAWCLFFYDAQLWINLLLQEHCYTSSYDTVYGQSVCRMKLSPSWSLWSLAREELIKSCSLDLSQSILYEIPIMLADSQ